MKAIGNGEHVHQPRHWQTADNGSVGAAGKLMHCADSVGFVGVKDAQPQQLDCGHGGMGEYRQIGIQPVKTGRQRCGHCVGHLDLALIVSIDKTVEELYIYIYVGVIKLVLIIQRMLYLRDTLQCIPPRTAALWIWSWSQRSVDAMGAFAGWANYPKWSERIQWPVLFLGWSLHPIYL